MDIEKDIDSITLDFLFKRLKHSVSQYDILKWLTNFDDKDVSLAIDILQNITVYTTHEIEEVFQEKLSEILRSVPAAENIVILPIGDFGKSGSMMAYLVKKTDVFRINPRRIQLISKESEICLLPSNVSTLVLIDDFIGSGQSTIKYLQGPINCKLGRFSQKYLMAVAGIDVGIEKLRSEFTDIKIPGSNIFKKAFSRDSSYFGYRRAGLPHRVMAHKYGCRLTRPTRLKSGGEKHLNALGFDNSQGLVAFTYGSPNNALPIIWSGPRDGASWHPLIPRLNHHKIQAARELRKKILFELSLFREFGSENLRSEFSSYHVERGIRSFSSVNHIDFSIYAIIKLSREGFSNFHICQKLGITDMDFKRYLIEGKKRGIFDKRGNITVNGLELYRDAKKCIKNSMKTHYEYDFKYNIQEVNYIPKKFNGRS